MWLNVCDMAELFTQADCLNASRIKFIQSETDWIYNKKTKRSWHTVTLSAVLELEYRHVATVTVNWQPAADVARK
jgi:hypothetical protein